MQHVKSGPERTRIAAIPTPTEPLLGCSKVARSQGRIVRVQVTSSSTRIYIRRSETIVVGVLSVANSSTKLNLRLKFYRSEIVKHSQLIVVKGG